MAMGTWLVRLLGAALVISVWSTGCCANGRVKTTVAGDFPDGIAVGEGAVWVAVRGNFRDPASPPGFLLRVDPESCKILDSIPVGGRPCSVAVAHSAVWVTNWEHTKVSRIDPRTRAESKVGPVEGRYILGQYKLAADQNNIWVHNCTGTIAKIDPKTGTAQTWSVSHCHELAGIAAGSNQIWVLGKGKLFRLDPNDGKEICSVTVGIHGKDVAFGEGSVWVVNAEPVNGTISRIDPSTNQVVATIPVGGDPLELAIGAGSIWVANMGSKSISRIDPATNRVVQSIHVGKSPRRLAFGEGALWFTSMDDHTLNRLEP